MILMWLSSQIESIPAFVISVSVFYAGSLFASPDFNPQYRWRQGGITVADNHEKPPAENNSNATDNNETSNENNKEAKDNQKNVTEEDNVDKTIETLETSIQIDDIIEPPASYRYSSFNKRDPFAYPDREEFIDDEFVVSRLQRHDVSSLKLVGVWRLSTGVSKALILTPSGEGVVAVIGDPVGQNNGEVMEIGRNKIIIREYLMTPDGTRQFNDIDMFLEDYFGDEVGNGGVVLEKSPEQGEQGGEASLEEELNKFLKNLNKSTGSVNLPTASAPNMPANAPNVPANAPNVPANAPNVPADAVNAPASTNAPSQP